MICIHRHTGRLVASLPTYVIVESFHFHTPVGMLLAKQCETIQGHSCVVIADFVIAASLLTYVYSGILPLLMGSIVA
jgi:hypothetical protein